MNRTKGTTSVTMYRRTSRRASFGAATPFATLLITVALLGVLVAHRPGVEASVVHTYRQTSSQLGQKVTSSTLMWEPYSATDLKQLEYAIQGGRFISEDEHYPIYVCRVTIDGVQTSGQTQKQKQSHLCVVSYLKEVKKYKRFDVLVNRGNLGKISWKPWRKFNAGIPLGAVSVDDYTYIARRSTSPTITDHLRADYTLGRFDPTLGLGKILVVEKRREREYDDGEVLVETEPFRYELKNIILDKIRTDIRINTTELASGILENDYDKVSYIDMVLSYSYDRTQYWGTHEGVARGLVTVVDGLDAFTRPTELNWGLKHSEKRYETKSVSASLQPGTAINVTLLGDYVTMEAPYVAKLFAYYLDSKEMVSRNISAEVRMSYLKDVKLKYSPVYWVENGTLMSTTTTTTTSTTTHATTTLGSSGLKPIDEPPIVYMADIGRSSDGSPGMKTSGSLDDAGNDINDNMIPNESRENYAENLKHMKGATSPGASNSTRLYCWTNSILILLISLTVRVFG